MALFPSGNIISYSSEDSEIRERLETFYNDAMMVNQTYWHEASIDSRFNAGDQTLWSELYSVPIRTRKNFSFNRIRRITNLLSGYQRRTRKSMIATPEENASQETADQLTKLLSRTSRTSKILDTVSESFNGAIITGMNLLEVWVDYRNDPISGEIKVDNCSYNSFIIDPYFRKKDLSDCNAMWKRSFLTKEACMSLVPDKTKEIEEMTSYYSDGKFPYLPENELLRKNLLAYDEFYYRDYRKQKLLVDVNLGDTIEWTGSNEALKEFMSMHPQLEVIETTIPTVKLALFVNGTVVYNGRNPLNIDTYPFIPVFGYFDPDIYNFPLRIQGIVRGLRDTQYLFNRRKIAELDYVQSVSGNGYIYKEDSLIDPDSPLKTGNGNMIRLKKSADMGDFIPIPQNDLPNSWPQLTEMLAKEFQEISGASEELLGVADDFKSAALAKMRHGWALIQQQTLFDQLDSSLQLLGEIVVKVIQSNYTPGKVRKIIDEEPTQEFYNKKFSKYNIAIEEGFDTSTQKQHEFTQLVVLKEMGLEIPDSALINAATIQNKDELIQMMDQQKQQAQQMEQQQMQMNMAEQQATINMVNSRGESDRAMAKKRESDIEKDNLGMITDTMEAGRKEQEANLDAIKVLKDLEQSDPNKIDELVELMRIIQEERDQMTQEIQEPMALDDAIVNQQMQQEPMAYQEAPEEQAFQEEMMQPEEQGMPPDFM